MGHYLPLCLHHTIHPNPNTFTWNHFSRPLFPDTISAWGITHFCPACWEVCFNRLWTKEAHGVCVSDTELQLEHKQMLSAVCWQARSFSLYLYLMIIQTGRWIRLGSLIRHRLACINNYKLRYFVSISKSPIFTSENLHSWCIQSSSETYRMEIITYTKEHFERERVTATVNLC